MGHPGRGRHLDVVGGEPSVLDVDPEPVEVTLLTQIVDDVVMEHPPHRKDHQTLPALQTMFHRLGHVTPLQPSGKMYNADY